MKYLTPPPRKVVRLKKKRGRNKATLFATVNQWATEAGMDDETLKRWLKRADITVVPDELIPAHVILRCLRGGGEAARTAKTIAETELLEIEKAEKRKELVPRAEFESDIWSSILLPFRTDFLALAKKLKIDEHVEELMDKHFTKKDK